MSHPRTFVLLYWFGGCSVGQVIMATNKIETLDPALIRPGRIDRKIEFPLPDIKTKRRIFGIHTVMLRSLSGYFLVFIGICSFRVMSCWFSLVYALCASIILVRSVLYPDEDMRDFGTDKSLFLL